MRGCIILLLTICSLNIKAQKEFVYSNPAYGIEINFPSKPTVTVTSDEYADRTEAVLILSTAGLAYQLYVSKSNMSGWSESMNKMLERTYEKVGKIIDKFEINNNRIIELEMASSGASIRQKIVLSGRITFTLTVTGGQYVNDKDVLPFFNSLKINGRPIQNPNKDNTKYTAYNIDYSDVVKTDTIKQIVYVDTTNKSFYQFKHLSDVDKGIPASSSENAYRFALIIGNEDYASRQTGLKSEMNVEFARNDASAFKEYCAGTLGVPEKNITFLLDATRGQINQGVDKLKLLSKACSGKAQLILFYAGHGLPDEVTKEPYLIPVDVSGADITSGIKLKDLYENLTMYPADRITVFLDACFTGGGRNAGLLAARGVKIIPKAEALKGNIVVYSSSSGEESSLPYSEKKHGMFTYFLLKKIQETRGAMTYEELSAYLQEKVALESLLINSKEQSPVVNTGQDASAIWKSWTIK
jgi:hypothetical protein